MRILNQLLQSRAVLPLLIGLYGMTLMSLGGNSSSANTEFLLCIAVGALVVWVLDKC